MDFFAGIDIGASTTKAIIINEKNNILGYAVNSSGADFQAASDQAFRAARQKAGLSDSDKFFVISTGYGRRNVPYANDTKTEISCHAEGSYFYCPRAHTLIDIGGQDSKVIKIDDAGRRTNFKMNRKCAAGTGAFLEETALRLNIELKKLNELAEKAENNIEIGSYCTVFTGTEILARIREGVPVADIVKGIFYSVLKRIMEMDSLEENIVMTGGVVAHNSFLVKMLEEKIDKEIFVPPNPQLIGAFGAALYSSKSKGELNA